MSNNKLFRFAGWCALVGALFFLGAFLSFPLGVIMLGGILEILSFLAIIFVFYGLYLAHRDQSSGLSLAGFFLAAAGIIIALAALVANLPVLFANLWYLLLALAFLLFGYLSFRGDKIPRGLAVLELLTGVLFLAAGVGGFFAGPEFADSVSSLAEVLMLAWLFWLWRVFWSKRFAAA